MNRGKTDIIEVLVDTFCFASELTFEQLENLANHAILEEVPAGTIIAEKGSYCGGLALVLSGVIRVAMTSEDGREVTMYRIEKGRICPLSAACILGDFKGNTVTVMAETTVKVIWVEREFFAQSFSSCEPFYRFVMCDISNRLFEATAVVDSLAFISVRKRLAQFLLTNSKDGKLTLHITHEAIARELGTVREVVSRELKGFEKLGILTMSRGRIDIIDLEGLEELVCSKIT